MEIIFTEHAMIRLRQRNISKEQANLVLKSPDRLNESFAKRRLASKKIENKTLEVIFVEEKERIIIITAYWLEE